MTKEELKKFAEAAIEGIEGASFKIKHNNQIMFDHEKLVGMSWITSQLPGDPKIVNEALKASWQPLVHKHPEAHKVEPKPETIVKKAKKLLKKDK